jgi:hypothetical protein
VDGLEVSAWAAIRSPYDWVWNFLCRGFFARASAGLLSWWCWVTQKLSLNVTDEWPDRNRTERPVTGVTGQNVLSRRRASTCGCYRVAPMSPGTFSRMLKPTGRSAWENLW